jgi:uncharacterized protein YkwD
MTRARIAAAVFASSTLLAAATFAMALRDGPSEPAHRAAIEPLTTTTTEPDFAALVASGVPATLSEAEMALTDEALTRSTSTTTTVATTTTTAPTSTTTVASKSSPTTTGPATAPPPTSSVQAGFRSAAETEFASRINSFRSDNGRSALTKDAALDSYARTWAKELAGRGALSHSDIGSLLPPWSAVGENVGQGGSVESIFGALANSSGHRANMLENFTHMGIGVWEDAAGVLWTAHVFTR